MLCKTAISEKGDPFKQNTILKDEIFYDFNAKYSRAGFTERVISSQASLFDDRNSTLTLMHLVGKYVGLVEDPATGQFINNIKHLRGSTMRILRSYQDKEGWQPAWLVLKGYSLFVLTPLIRSLLDEEKKELLKGLILWKKQEDSFNPVAFVSWLKEKVAKHVDDRTVTEGFDDIEDLYYASYYADRVDTLYNTKLITI